GLGVRPDPWRWLFPSRLSAMTIDLPTDPGWERWGPRLTLARAAPGLDPAERDVNFAAHAAAAANASLSLMLHDSGTSPDLSGVRAMLEWAARGGQRAVHVMPLSMDRVSWVRSAGDLLQLVEQSTLRGNPFDVRGRVMSSSQFFDRERLVSGLLA